MFKKNKIKYTIRKTIFKPAMKRRKTNLHGDQPVVHHHLFGQKVGTDRGLILVAELVINILVH